VGDTGRPQLAVMGWSSQVIHSQRQKICRLEKDSSAAKRRDSTSPATEASVKCFISRKPIVRSGFGSLWLSDIFVGGMVIRLLQSPQLTQQTLQVGDILGIQTGGNHLLGAYCLLNHQYQNQ